MREFWFESEGVRLFAVEDGAGDAIVMLHGGMASHLTALPLIKPLVRQYRVIAPDLRGSGKSHCGATLTFEQLATDVEALMNHLGVQRAVVAGISSGSGVAVRFALRYPERTIGLLVVTPVYAGTERGYTHQQKSTFAQMNALASRALAEGVQVLEPMYENLPIEIRQRALAMIEGFDAASVVATSHFIASGVQPFASASDLHSLRLPTLLVRGDDFMHPAEVSDLYASNIPNCRSVAATAPDLTAIIGAFVAQCLHSATQAFNSTGHD